jgi:hypothetical protein
MKNRKPLALHPFLFAAYPTIALVAYNIEEIKISDGYRSLIGSILLTAILLLLLALILHSRYQAALITSACVVLFFSYGHIYHLLRESFPVDSFLARHRTLVPIYIVFTIFLVYIIVKRGKNWLSIHNFLNIIGIFALAYPLFQITYYSLKTEQAQLPSTQDSISSSLHLSPGKTAPDIYYIILDAYSRDDILESYYKYNNSKFVDQLQSLGFFVATCSQSNYAQTQLSLSSSLNMDYLSNLSARYSAGSTSRVGLSNFIHHNRTRQLLENLGYTVYAFETGFKTTEWVDADHFLSPRGIAFRRVQLAGGLTDFEALMLKDSAGILIEDGITLLPQILRPDLSNPLKIHRDLILFDLQSLAELPKEPGPKFVFAHMVIPHPPFVFGPHGEFTDYDLDFNTGYKNQISYINSRMIPLLQDIIANSSTPPVIIIQGDHGGINAPPDGRMKILNAYYFPEGGNQYLYQSISPVNSFRVLFDAYFNGNYPIIADISNFSVYQKPYEYTIIQDKRTGCQGNSSP